MRLSDLVTESVNGGRNHAGGDDNNGIIAGDENNRCIGGNDKYGKSASSSAR